MLRPAVAATNCASAGETRGLDIERRRLSLDKCLNRPCRAGRSPKVPAPGGAVNEMPKTALSPGRDGQGDGAKGNAGGPRPMRNFWFRRRGTLKVLFEFYSTLLLRKHSSF